MQLATLLIGLISATALWSGVQALNQQARSSYDRAAAAFGGARTPMLVGRLTIQSPGQTARPKMPWSIQPLSGPSVLVTVPGRKHFPAVAAFVCDIRAYKWG